MDAQAWDERYAAEPGMWGSPNATVIDLLDGLSPGRAVDLACGDGRHAAWLASHGWQVEAVDFSRSAIEQARRRPETEHDRIDWAVGDVLTWEPSQAADLVLVAYLHLTALGKVLERATTWLGRSSGTLVYLGHARENIERGVGGPQEAGVLPSVEQLAASLGGARVRRLEHVQRETGDGTAIDVLAVVSPWP